MNAKKLLGVMWIITALASVLPVAPLQAQTLLNVDFGVGSKSAKIGFAATGQTTNDFWNLYRHYDPKFVPGAPLVADGQLADLKLADGTPTPVMITVSNAPGVWGNASGDPMFDTYLFAQNGSNIIVTVTRLEPGRYHFYLYGHADADVTGEQNSIMTLRCGTNTLGPATPLGSLNWKAGTPWEERRQYVVFRDVPVEKGQPVVIEVAPGINGIAVLNGLQISSRGTSPPKLVPAAVRLPATLTNLLFREVNYEGRVTDSEARFTVSLEVESPATNEISAPLFEGEIAVLANALPEGLRLAGAARKYRLFAAKPGRYQFKLELLAKITKAEPWNKISFMGPNAAVATVKAEADTPGVEMQLLSGTQSDGEAKATSKLSGLLGADRVLAMQWQSKAAEVSRKSLVTVETTASAQITPTVIKYTTQLRYEILQAAAPKLTLGLPIGQALTRLQGEQIRDWQVKPDGERQLLTLEFIKPVEKAYSLTLYSEQAVEGTPVNVSLAPPQPLEIERESGSFSLSADEMLVEIESATGLRQVNATGGALAAYRFAGRPFAVAARLKRVEPVVKSADRVTARLEETRLQIVHALKLSVDKAGIYAVELTPQPGFNVTEVRGEGVDDWKVADVVGAAGRKVLRVNFGSRVLGTRQLHVQLEQALKTFPDQIVIDPLRVAGATNETAQIGAASAMGIQLKTAGELAGLREISINALPNRADELLAFVADQGDWRLALAAEKLSARLMADIFNLVTIGDGLVGGSGTVRFGILNQGVQEFKVRLPSHWKNVEFTGPNIRRKEPQTAPTAPAATNAADWTISLQDKVWGGYTLVVTYDYQFDPKKATLDLAGLHAPGVERETGSLALTTIGSLKVQPRPLAAPLRAIDQTELAETDRALITRPVYKAYRYTGTNFALLADVVRYEEVPVLDAVADHTQITSVLTEEGQMLTQASFMVKNNDRQFQKFRLPQGAKLWGCYVNNEPAKAEQDKEWLMVSLPRGANRDEAFAVDIKYEQKLGSFKNRLLPTRLELMAPTNDIPNTFAEWQLFVPPSQRLFNLGGNMTAARGPVYTFYAAWRQFVTFYFHLWRVAGEGLLIVAGLGVFIGAIVAGLVRYLRRAPVTSPPPVAPAPEESPRRGGGSVITWVIILAVILLLAAISIPNFVKARTTAQANASINNLRQISGAIEQFALENKRQTAPPSMEDIIGNDKYIRAMPTDPATGQPYVYVGAGKRLDNPNAIVLHSADRENPLVLFANGNIEQMDAAKFNAALQREAASLPGGGWAANQPVPAAAAPATRGQFQLPAQSSQPAPGGAAFAQIGGPPGFVGGVNAPGGLAGLAPTAAGVRSIRIDIPRTGRSIFFTKVLNLTDEPLTIKMTLMRGKAFAAFQTLLHLAIFLAGLIVLWRQWQRGRRSSFWLAVGVALALGAVGSLFLAWERLHWVFIVAAPALGLLVLGWLVRKYWRRLVSKPAPPPSDAPPPIPDAGPGPMAPATALVLWGALATALTVPVQAQVYDGSLPPLTNAATLISGQYQGTIKEKVAQFDVEFKVLAASTNQWLPLFGDEVALEKFSTTNAGLKLMRQGGTVNLHLEQPGEATVQLKLLVKLGGDVSKRRLQFGVPAALASKLAVTFEEADAEVEFPTAVAFKRTTTQPQTRIEAVLGAGDKVEMTWTPRMKRVAETEAAVFAQTHALVTLGNGVVNTRATLEYQIAQGELRQLKVRLPAGQRLLRVEGETLRTWALKDEGNGQVLAVELLKGVTANYRLMVETETLLDKLPAQVKVEVPQPLDVKRATGLLALCGVEELGVTVESAQDLQRVDAAEFARGGSDKAEGIIGAYRFLKPGFQLAARAEAIQPQIEAVARHTTRIGFEQISLVMQVDYTIKKAGIFGLQLNVPEDYKIDSVLAVDAATRLNQAETQQQRAPDSRGQPLQWVEKANPRRLDVALKDRTLGPFSLRVYLSKVHKELPKTIEIAGLHPLGVQKLNGFVAVSAEQGIAVKTGAFDGLTEIPAALLPEGQGSGSGVLAFKYQATEVQAAAAWKLAVTTEMIESWIRAEIVNLLSLTETLVAGRTLVRYDIQNAPVKEFRLKIPAHCRNVEINGANIRRRDQTGEEWRVELQNKVRGNYVLTITWELPRESRASALVLAPPFEALGVERETGNLVMMARPPLQVVEKSATDQLVKIDARELPEWAGVGSTGATTGGEVPVLVYRYLRPGYKLAVEAKRYEEAAVLQALVDSARLTTVVADDGQMMTEMALNIRNNGLQHLEIELPPKAQMWSAFVAGQPVRPTLREGKLLLPIERSGADEAPIAIELTYVAVDRFPKTKGAVSLASPKLDVPLKNAQWQLFLPPDFSYVQVEGSMAQGAEVAPVVQVYSQDEYQRQEAVNKRARQAELRQNLKQLRSQISSGNLRMPNADFNQFKQNYQTVDADSAKELKAIETDLRKAQGSNLIRAQKAYTVENIAKINAQPLVQAEAQGQQAQQVAAMVQYDNEIAEQQWAQLEKAQQVTVAKVQPLRVNLPKRGLRYTFTQVLQTEVKKPMTIRLTAANVKDVSWTKRLLLSVGGFLVLWIALAFLPFRRPTPR